MPDGDAAVTCGERTGAHTGAVDLERTKAWLVLLGVPLGLVAAGVVAIALWLGGSTTTAVAWDRSSVVGREVELHYIGSRCQDDAWIETEEEVDRVVLTVMTSSDADSCVSEGVAYTVSTTLSE